jgi:AcrR family transcriptional regulator
MAERLDGGAPDRGHPGRSGRKESANETRQDESSRLALPHMKDQPGGRRGTIVQAAQRTLGDDPAASVAVIAADAGVSRATFYRYFPSRAALLDELDIDRDPGTRERVLAAALELLARDGLARLSVDDVADRAGVSRASVYRLYPGKSALFGALLAAESPFGEISAALRRMGDRPPDEVLPELLRIANHIADTRLGVVRALMFEVSTGTPEAVDAAQALLPMLGDITHYFAAQMDAGTIRRMHPILAAQALVGPLIFHQVLRSIAAPLLGLEISSGAAAEEFAGVALRGLAPVPAEEL